jgi:DNA-binding YbaB/EbfC family protein
MFKGLGNIAGMVQQAKEMQQKMAEAKEKISRLQVEGIAGGEMVKAVVSGEMTVLSITIEPTLAESGDREMLEELVTAAVNQGLQKAKDAAAKEMEAAAGGMDMSGLQDMMSKLGLGQ